MIWMVRKTLQDLKNEDAAFLTANDICGVLGCDPHHIRCMAHQRPELLGFTVVIMGNRVKIPRIPFLRFMGVNV